jgi:hypothetical protein
LTTPRPRAAAPRRQAGQHHAVRARRADATDISAFQGNDTPLVFGGGNWTLHVEHDDNDPECGGLVYAKATGTYALPQPAQAPITLLTGHDHLDESSGKPDCAWTVDFDETYTRTGD